MKTIQLVGYSHPVYIDSIVWLEAEANYTRIHYKNSTSTIVTQSLQWFEHHLNFIRVHRSVIVNPDYIQDFGYKSGRSGWIRLVNNKRFDIARNRLERTVSQLNALAGSNPPNLLSNQ